MSKIVISYVLSTLAGVADVSPSDVETSMFNGLITLNNVALRPTFVPGVLFDSAHVDKLEVRLPILTSDAPIVAHATGTTLVFPLDLAGPPTERAFADILASITNAAILGYNPVDAAATVDADVRGVIESAADHGSGGDSPHNDSLATSFASDAIPPHGGESDGEDLLSCNSAGEHTDVESTASDSEPEEEPAQGFFARWRAKAVRGFGKRWRHATRIELEDAKIVLPCDTRTGMCFQAHVDSFVVTIEPQEMMETEQLSVHRLELRGIRVLAHVDDTNEPRVVDVDALDVTITCVYHPKSGRLLRKNTAVAFTGACAVVADENTLFALIKCQMTRDIMMRLPDYCRPFANLRRQRSLWKYVGCCLIKQIQDRKHRYNFTLSHLRFYADSRRRYMDLLDACHRSHDVDPRRQELAEAEQDLRYADVIQFLRQCVRDKYGPPPPPPPAQATTPSASPSRAVSTSVASPVVPSSPSSPTARPTITSVHIGWELVRIQLPDRQAVLVSDISVVTRDAEQLAHVGNVTLVCGDQFQSLVKSAPAVPGRTAAGGDDKDDTPPTTAPTLLTVERKLSDGFVNTKITVAEVSVSLEMAHLLAMVKPLLDTAIQIGLRERFPVAAPAVADADDSGASAEGVASAAGAAPPTLTFIVAVPHISCRLDDLVLLVDRCSTTVVMPPVGPPQFGCTLRELSVQTVSDKAYVLSPVVVSMSPTGGGVVVSDVDVLVRRSLWDYLRAAARELPSIPVSLSDASAPAAAAAPSMASSTVTHEALQSVKSVQTWSQVGTQPAVQLAKVSIAFEPMATTVSVSRVQVVKVQQRERSSPKYSCLSVNVGDITVACRDAPSSLCLTVELSQGVTAFLLPQTRVLVCVPDVRVGYTLPAADAAATLSSPRPQQQVSLLSVTTTCVCMIETTCAVDVARVVVSEAVELGPLRIMYVTDPYAVPSSFHPYRASFMQCDVALRRVAVAPLVRLDVALLAAVGEELFTFVVDELVPTSLYQNFFSAFSDMALNLTADACPIELIGPTVNGASSAVAAILSLLPRCTGHGTSSPCGFVSATSRTPLTSTPSLPMDGGATAGFVTPPPASLSTAARRMDLRDFGPPLFPTAEGAGAAAGGRPVVVRFDTRRRSLIMDVDVIELCVAHPAQSTAVRLCAHQLAVEVPVGNMDFWSEEVRHKLPVDPSFTASRLRTTVESRGLTVFDAVLRNMDIYTGSRSAISAAAVASPTCGALSSTASGSVAAAAAVDSPTSHAGRHTSAFALDGVPAASQRSPSVASEMGSFASWTGTGSRAGSPSQQDKTVVTSLVGLQMEKWTAEVNLSVAEAVYESLVRSAATFAVEVPAAVVAALAARQYRLTASCSGRTFDLDRLGTVFLDSPVDLLVLEDCVFTAKNPTAANTVIVTSGSSVLFRRCTFPWPIEADSLFLRTADALAVFVCEDCQLATGTDASPDAATDGVVATVTDTAGRTVRHRVRRHVEVGRGRLAVLLPDQRVLEVTQPRPLRAHYTRAGTHPTAAWSGWVHPLQCAVLYRTIANTDDACVTVCQNVSLDADIRSTSRRRALAVTVALTVEEVCIPLDSAPATALQRVLAVANRSAALFAAPATDGLAPPAPAPTDADAASQPSQPLLWEQWKVLLSVSLVPIRVCLPNPTLTVAKLTLSNAFFWSVKEANHTAATVEGRFAITEVFLRDLEAERLAPVLSTSTFVDLQGAFTTPHASVSVTPPAYKVSLAVRLPHTELTLNTDQMRLLSTIARHGVGASVSAPSRPATADGSCLFPPPGVVFQSFLGASSVELQTTSGETIQVVAAACETTIVRVLAPRQSLDMPRAITAVDQVLVARTVPLSLPDDAAARTLGLSVRCEGDCEDPTVAALTSVPVLHRKHYGVALSDGRRLLCSASLLTNGTTWVTLRSLLVVCNRSPVAVCFRSDFSAPWPLEAGVVGSLPLRIADTIGQLSLSVSESAGVASLQEVLWGGTSPSALLAKWLPQHGGRQQQVWGSSPLAQPPPSSSASPVSVDTQEKEFVLLKDGSSLFLRLSTTRVAASGADGWCFLQLDICASAPSLRNDMHVPLSVELCWRDATTPPLQFTLAPTTTLTLTAFSAQHLASSCFYRLGLEMRPGVWARTNDNDDGDDDAGWLRTRSAVRFYQTTDDHPDDDSDISSFFSASVVEVGAGMFTVSPAQLVRLCNMTGLPLSLVSETARVTLRPMSVDAPSPAYYVPRHAPIYVRRGPRRLSGEAEGGEVSEGFELDDPASGASRSGAFVSCGETRRGDDDEGIAGSQRCFLIRPALTDGADFAIQAPTWLVNRTAGALRFVWTTTTTTSTEPVNAACSTIDVIVPPQSRVPFCWLPVSGRQSHFRFQPHTTATTSPSPSAMTTPRIPGEWNPGTRQSCLVQCGARLFFPVTVRKARFCDAAVIAVGPPCPPPLKIVNCTTLDFKDIAAAQTRLVNRPIRTGDSLQLVPMTGAASLWVALDEAEGQCVVQGTHGSGDIAWRRIRDRRGHVVVVLVRCTPAHASIVGCHHHHQHEAPPLSPAAAAPSSFVALLCSQYGLDVSVTLQRVSLAVTHRELVTVRMGMDSARVWVDMASASCGGLSALQCTIEGVQILNAARVDDPRTTTTVLAPAGLNLSARDAALDLTRHRRLMVATLQLQMRPLVLTVSDVFLYTVQQILAFGVTACPQGGVATAVPSRLSLTVDPAREITDAVTAVLDSPAPVAVVVKTASVSEVSMEVSYDRSVVPPDDFSLLRDVPMLALLPSLYHARILLNARVFHNVGGTSAQRALAPIVETYLSDFLAQLPSTIRSVGFFRGASLLQTAASKLAGLFSSTATDTQKLLPHDGSALL